MYAKQMENDGRYRSNRALANAYLAITPIEGLTWKTLVSYDYASSSTNNFTGGVYTQRFNYVDGQRINVVNGLAGGKDVSGDAYYSPRNGNEYTLNLRGDQDQTLVISNTLTFHKKFDVHDITVMLGHEKSRWYGMYTSADATGFESQYNRSINLTTNMYESRKGNGELKLEERFVSYFGRINYALMDRYLLTATLRRDGSSKFGVKNYWGTFPSVAAGWRISEEPFMKSVDWVSNLKLRFGWGQTGNSGKNGDYAVTGLRVDGRYVYYTPGAAMGLGNNPAVIAGFYPELKDLGLKWEANEQINVGVDASLFNGQLVASVDYFVRTSKDLLLDRAIRATSGYQKIYTNYGEIENSGIEIMLGWNKRFNNDLSLNVTLTGSTLKNKVKKMGDPIFNTNSDSSGQGTGDGSNTGAVGSADGYHWGNHSICKEGEAVGSFYGYRTDGVIRTQEELDAYKAYFTGGMDGTPTIGDYRFKDLNGDHTLNSSDMEILGNGFPAFNYGLNIGLTWKNWDANIQMHGVFGQDIYSYSAMRLTNMFSSDDGCAPNILKSSASDAWSPSNPNGSEARLSITDKNNNMRASDAWVKNGDFLKISNLQIGYNLPKDFAQKLLIQSARIYLGIQNLACISGYNKYGDPECGQGSVLYTGLDTGRYPMPRTYNFGVNVTF
jgi:TonB-linked SusC/RagA family outer membrane protein